jgi:hypothetical protein
MKCLLNRTTCFLECPKWQECECEMKNTVRNGFPIIGSMIIFWGILVGCVFGWLNADKITITDFVPYLSIVGFFALLYFVFRFPNIRRWWK